MTLLIAIGTIILMEISDKYRHNKM